MAKRTALSRSRLCFVFLACAQCAFSQSGPPAKETLAYRIEWRLVTAGRATMDWSAVPEREHPGWEIKLHLASAGLVSKLYKVEDDYTVNLSQALCAQSSVMTAREGNR